MADEQEKPNEEHEHHEPKAEKTDGKQDEEKPHSSATDKPAEEDAPAKKRFDLKAFLATKKGRIIAAVAGVVLLLVVLFAVPATRYAILGTVIKKEVTLTLTDKTTNKPVSDAEVMVATQTIKSDSNGTVKLSLPVGPLQVTVKKKYYHDLTQTVNVWLTKTAEPAALSLEATGRQVPVRVVNKISLKPVQGATLTAAETTAITDEKGEATLVLPADQGDQKGKITLKDHNDLDVTVTLTDQPDDKNVFALTPAGKLYFLSKRTGKINVMKSNLDGTDAKVAVEGTGKEEEHDTILLASRDWKYLILKARRDSERPKVYVIDTSNDKLSVVDEGNNASFELTGWADHYFIYRVNRDGDFKEDNARSIKSYNADTGKLVRIDGSSGGHSQEFPHLGETYDSGPIIVGNDLFFSTRWSVPYSYIYGIDMADKKNGMYTMKVDGTGKKALAEVKADTYDSYRIRLFGADEIYVLYSGDNKVLEYEGGKLVASNTNANDFDSKSYPTYLVSPSGNTTFWTDSRDGKNTLLLGNKSGHDEKVLAELSDYRQYGWFTDDYLLVSKGGSELSILARTNPANVLKITDYHKPAINFYNYGGGYGGF